ncbi:unnamed protein product [Kuraishia capsulata CBS 1993]|uniref:Uncharacterized protein n=1 Tax=Kuraishia capsulata CBS 1993 TaxID=1382522 RepID=W6MJ36_9ASCO|nr:uncharacterized protein KUCA_T00002207001 [Kuraishia capsulata CBS 1993]CDK26236.1 unnamed protein product [Kuraishia capsulata CBS 1993]
METRQQLLQDDPNFAIDLLNCEVMDLTPENLTNVSFEYHSQDRELENLRRARRLTRTSSVEADVSSLPMTEADYDLDLNIEFEPIDEELNFTFGGDLTMEHHFDTARAVDPLIVNEPENIPAKPMAPSKRRRVGLTFDKSIYLSFEDLRHTRVNYVNLMVDIAKRKMPKLTDIKINQILGQLNQLPQFELPQRPALLLDSTVSSEVENARRLRRSSTQSSTTTDTLHVELPEFELQGPGIDLDPFTPSFDLVSELVRNRDSSTTSSRSSSRAPRGRFDTLEEAIDEDSYTEDNPILHSMEPNARNLYRHIAKRANEGTITLRQILPSRCSRKVAVTTLSGVLLLATKGLVYIGQSSSFQLENAENIVIGFAAQF